MLDSIPLVSEQNSIFALDIGTRTVIGIVGVPHEQSLRVIAQDITEHESRTMIDGQIHDVVKVAAAVSKVKANLEQKVGFPLQKVAIAAAGRTLRTKHTQVTMEINEDIEIDPLLVNSLELAGIRQAHQELEAELAGPTSERFYCVGYTVVTYSLDNWTMTSLIGHRGRVIGANILATFLPQSVVNGLYSVLKRCNLEPISLTLEPIAAIDVAIPENLRLLNLALVDIGAGTSDIALTSKGAITAYGMVPIAGDEITEVIAEALLVDFQTAEFIKRSLGQQRDITYRDVLELEQTISSQDVMAIIDPVVNKLADEIAQAIINLNGGQPPSAVFCVGGGSQLPTLTDKLAERLQLPPRRVGIRGRQSIPGLVVDDPGIAGPEGVTVVGIATVALKKIGHDFINIKVNGEEFRLFNSKEINVANAIALIGFNPRRLIGHNGRSVEFFLNGQLEVVPGEMAKPAQISVNGHPANLSTPVASGDSIVIKPAEDGRDAQPLIRDYLAYKNIDLAEVTILVNQVEVTPDYVIQDGDCIELKNKREVEDTSPSAAKHPHVPPAHNSIKVQVNGQEVTLTDQANYIFVDIFTVIQFDLSQPKGKIYLRLNGQEAQYTDPLKDGDIIEVGWES